MFVSWHTFGFSNCRFVLFVPTLDECSAQTTEHPDKFDVCSRVNLRLCLPPWTSCAGRCPRRRWSWTRPNSRALTVTCSGSQRTYGSSTAWPLSPITKMSSLYLKPAWILDRTICFENLDLPQNRMPDSSSTGQNFSLILVL